MLPACCGMTRPPSPTRQHASPPLDPPAEGNYLLLPAEPWWRLQELWDDTWYVDCCLEEAMGRVFARQVRRAHPPRSAAPPCSGVGWRCSVLGSSALAQPPLHTLLCDTQQPSPASSCTTDRRATGWQQRCPAGASLPTTGRMQSRFRPRAAAQRWWCLAPSRLLRQTDPALISQGSHACDAAVSCVGLNEQCCARMHRFPRCSIQAAEAAKGTLQSLCAVTSRRSYLGPPKERSRWPRGAGKELPRK